MAQDTPPRWDRKMQQRLARGEAAALSELYDRYAALVHGLAHRVLEDDEAADHTTREVFAYVWEHPHAYDPRYGSLRAWMAGVTQRQAAGRLRRQHGGTPEEVEEKVRAASAAARADYIVTSMPASLRAALELAYFQRRDYRQTAEHLGVTEDEARRRLRLGLQLLSSAVARPLPAVPGAPGSPGASGASGVPGSGRPGAPQGPERAR
ncbi:sigma-70 family RNA polymerase sigma factor [Streptomyces sp. JJ36]|uniref:sigma-70 family RNA polymerase sigma factor n=1 Tax=Streptomyces sp. JJ36 TaxID=2736645 RepID=UPI001F031E21|nr:sigma-70 family RNA polymerase sigma factor [Streptomyces sp. JJ36]MCF6525940.1 sigma-70 family RNA polymerase sigma factor [Streptomyces sp. JJ36]